MDISKTKWQHACGDDERNYPDICLKWDVILCGPGYAGTCPECEEKLKKDGRSARQITNLKRFAAEMQDGDIVVLRLKTKKIFGVGVIVGDYEWLEEFSDIEGWDLQHVRRVRWLWKYKNNPKEFKTYALKMGDTTQILKETPAVLEWLETLAIEETAYERKLVTLPKSSNKKEVKFDEVSEYLCDQGVSHNSVKSLIIEINDLLHITKWYYEFGYPSEAETLTYLVVPLLRALGWTRQKMAIEWKKIDIALFSQLPRTEQNLNIVVEVKKKGSFCLATMWQAQNYAQGKENCNRLIVTDGLRYGIYIKNGESFKLHAYFNLTALKNDHQIYECHGIKEALRAMTPEWNG